MHNFKGFLSVFSAAFLACAFLAPQAAHAQCASPAGVENEIEYFDADGLYKYCNGTNWINIHAEVSLGANITNGLVGYWKLDETSGTTAVDSSGNGHDATMDGATGGALNATDDSVPGHVDTALHFETTAAVLALPTAVTSGLNEITISFWIKTTEQGPGVPPVSTWPNYPAMFGNKGSGTGADDIVINTTNGSIGYLHGLNGTASYERFDGGPAINDNQWHHVLLTYDSTQTKLYLDGSFVPGSTLSTDGSNLNAIAAGFGNWNAAETGYSHAGYYDDLRIYNRALSESEITQVYDSYCSNHRAIDYDPLGHGRLSACLLATSTEPSATEGLVGHWRLDETSGSTIVDSSGSGYNGTWSDSVNNDVAEETSAGNVTNALHFDGSNDTIDISSAAAITNNVSALTGAVWINIDSLDTGDIIAFGVGGGGPTQSSRFTIEVNNSDELTVGARSTNAESYRRYDSTSSPLSGKIGQWVHVAGVVDYANDTIQLYVDGVLEGENTSVGFSSNSTPADDSGSAAIGAEDNGANDNFDGLIDDVRMYDRALSAADVAEIYYLNSPGLVGHWKMDETSGSSISDSSGNSNDGTWSDGVDNDVTGESNAGQLSNALTFDGTNDYISVASSPDFSSTSMTMATWVYLDSTPANGWYTIMEHDRFGNNWYGLFMYGNLPHCRGSGNTAVNFASALSNGVWHHIACVYDGTNMTMYINGSVDATHTNATTATANASGLSIGSNQSSGEYLPARLDDLRLYSRALSASEVLALKETGSGGLIGHWTLDETSGATINDSSGYSNSGTWSDGVDNDVSGETTTGQVNTALDFDGSNDYIQIPDNSVFDEISDEVTVSLWVNSDTLPGGFYALAHRAEAGGFDDLWGLYTAGENYVAIIKTTSGQATAWVGGSASNDIGTWVHLALTYDGSTLRLYRNGTELTSTAHTGTFANVSDPMTIGAGMNGGSPGENPDAKIDDVKIYNRALTAAEIGVLSSAYKWHHMEYNVTGTGCTTAGERIYETVGKVWRYCNGSNWVEMSP